METTGWENLLLGVLVLLVIFWMWPGIKGSLAMSKEAPTDWSGLLLPIAAVVIFVIFLLMMV
ncbi:hypothetical protein Q9L42_002080 [Methylomarinum sp. Ch1-1]|uniref:Uncharacterized protein n=1 Tax=Methylomarinum roseum TaxID=3067653 RepID=A0AAU7NVE3_9GAMM|nr:hypothetical protein [Methylomarinum sp. Ch1-1]MDP4523036.1 hypothetical protein [Methylomarinum sp. Ch1-1]